MIFYNQWARWISIDWGIRDIRHSLVKAINSALYGPFWI